MLAELEQALELGGRQRRGIRRHHAEDRFHGHRHVVHQVPQLLRGLRIVGRVARDLATGLVRIGPAREVTAVVQRRHRALERQYLKSMSGQVQLTNNLRTQETHYI
jgi:hypothetical protein